MMELIDWERLAAIARDDGFTLREVVYIKNTPNRERRLEADLRDQFAMAALSVIGPWPTADQAYDFAETMMAEREKRNE